MNYKKNVSLEVNTMQRCFAITGNIALRFSEIVSQDVLARDE